MSYDTLKEAPFLIDEETEKMARQTAAENNLSPGEAFRQAAKKGFNLL